MVVPIVNSMARIDSSLIEAARDAGAGRFRIVREIVMPLSKTGIALGSIFVITQVMGDYFIVATMSGGKSASVVSAMQNEINALQYPPAAASSVVMLVIVTRWLRASSASSTCARNWPRVAPCTAVAGPALNLLRPCGVLRSVPAVPLRADDCHLHPVVPGADRRNELPDGRRVAAWFHALISQTPGRRHRRRLRALAGLALLVAHRDRGDLRAGGHGLSAPVPGLRVAFYLAIASLVMPGLFVGFGIALSFKPARLENRAGSPRASARSSPGRCRSAC